MTIKLRCIRLWISTALTVITACLWGAPVAAYAGINGRLLYSDTNNYPGAYQMISVKSDGTGATTVGAHDRTRRYPSWSPDGTKITYTAVFGSYQHIMIADADGSNPVQLTSGNNNNAFSNFSPDGTKIVYSHVATTYYEIWTMNIDGTSQAQLSAVADNMYRATYSPDGTKLVFESSLGGGDFEIYTMNSDGSGMTNLTNNSQHDLHPSWSPDGTKIVYAGLPTNPNYQLYTMNVNGSSVTQITSNAVNHDSPVYSPDGTKIAFRRGGSPAELYIVNIDGTNEVAVTASGWVDNKLDWQPLTRTPSTSNANPTVGVVGSTATIDVPNLYTDYYGGLNNASVTVTTAPSHGSTSVNTTTGLITYTQTTVSLRGSFLSRLSSIFFPKVSAVSQDSFTYRICSSASSSLCSTGTVGVVLASSSILVSAGPTGQVGSVLFATSMLGIVLWLNRRIVKSKTLL